MPSRRRRPLALLAAALLLAACADGGGAEGGAASRRSGTVSADAAVTAVPAGDGVAPAALTVAPAAATAPAPAPGEAVRDDAASTGDDPILPGAMLVRTGSARLAVDSLEPALEALRRGAAAIGGTIGSSTMSGGRETVRSATLELRLPAARWDEALAALRPLGTVESVETQVADVGEEYVDLGARLANARRLEERLVGLLATRTGRLTDVLAIERELARVREEIERREGRMRYLRTRAATSTLAITLHEPIPLVGASPQESVLGEAVADAWRLLVRTVAAAITALGVVVPVAALGGAAVLAVRRVRRRAGAAA